LQPTAGEVFFLRATNNSFFPEITCRLCGIKGHYQTHCPVAKNEAGEELTRNPGTERGGTRAATSGSEATEEEVFPEKPLNGLMTVRLSLAMLE